MLQLSPAWCCPAPHRGLAGALCSGDSMSRGSWPLRPPCAPSQRAGGARREGLGLCLEKGLIQSWRRGAAQHSSPLLPLLWQRRTKPSQSAEPLVCWQQQPKSAFQFPDLATLNLTLNFGAFGWRLTVKAWWQLPRRSQWLLGCEAGGVDALPHPCFAAHARIGKKGEKRGEIMLMLVACSFQEDSCCLLAVAPWGTQERCCPQ